jgi:cytochrome c biogenesis protein ResB
VDPIWFLAIAALVLAATIVFCIAVIAGLMIGLKRAAKSVVENRDDTRQRGDKTLALSAERNQLLRELIAAMRETK